MESVPPAGRDAEGCEITKVCALFCPAAKDVHDIVDKSGSVALARSWDIAYTVELRPFVDGGIIAPNIIEPLETIGTSKAVLYVSMMATIVDVPSNSQVHLVVVGNH